MLAGVAVGLNLTPIMLHRRVFGDHVKDRVVETGQVLSQVVIAAVAVLIVGTSVPDLLGGRQLDGRGSSPGRRWPSCW